MLAVCQELEEVRKSFLFVPTFNKTQLVDRFNSFSLSFCTYVLSVNDCDGLE